MICSEELSRYDLAVGGVLFPTQWRSHLMCTYSPSTVKERNTGKQKKQGIPNQKRKQMMSGDAYDNKGRSWIGCGLQS